MLSISAMANPNRKPAAPTPLCWIATRPTIVAEANGPITGMSSRNADCQCQQNGIGQVEDGTKADPSHHCGVKDDDTNADQVAAQYRHNLGQQILDRAPALGRQQPYRSG